MAILMTNEILWKKIVNEKCGQIQPKYIIFIKMYFLIKEIRHFYWSWRDFLNFYLEITSGQHAIMPGQHAITPGQHDMGSI